MPTEEQKIEAAQAAVPELKDDPEIRRFLDLWWSQVPLLLAELPAAGEPVSEDVEFGAIAILAVQGDLKDQLKEHIRQGMASEPPPT